VVPPGSALRIVVPMAANPPCRRAGAQHGRPKSPPVFHT
jgi:hypothetical protein